MEFPYVIFQSCHSIRFILGLIGKILKIVEAGLSIHLGKREIEIVSMLNVNA